MYYNDGLNLQNNAELCFSRDISEPRLSPVVLLLVPFIAGAISVATLPVANRVVIAMGAICVASYLIGALRSGFSMPKELIFLAAFIIWSLTGTFVAIAQQLVIVKIITMLQIFIMAVIIAHYASSTKAVSFMFWGALIGAAIVAASAVVTGEYQSAGAGVERAAGIAMNSNAFAMTLVYATIALLYFFKTWKLKILKLSVFGVLLIVGKLIISSGSRKGFISFALLLILWFAFSYAKDIFRKPVAALFTLAILLGLFGFMAKQMANTILGERLESAVVIAEGGISSEGSIQTRQILAREGIAFIKNSPIFGLGLNNFMVHSTQGLYSHNNYIEVTTGSGLPGGVLYYMVFVFWALRLLRLRKSVLSDKERDFLNIAISFLIVRLIVDIALVSYYTKISWIFLAILIGFTYHLEKRVKAQTQLEEYYPVNDFDDQRDI